MPEKPFTPPTRKPVSEFPTPDPTVAFYTELVNRDDPAYIANAPVSRGALYSTMVGAKRDVIATYPQLFFLRERKFQMDDQRVLWDWATDEQAHDSYNAEVTYVANAVTYPAFTRTYTVRRELYESDPTSVIGSPLPGIIAVTITSPGQNHTEAFGVIDGTSVAIKFTVDSNGSLINGVITNTGNELIQNGTAIKIIGDGQDSSAIAVTQPVGCVLTAQKKEELPDADPLSHELVKVTRTYETLPGPWIETTRFDVDGALVTSKTRRQVSDFITDNDLILNGEWIQTWHKGDDNFVAEENVEARPVPGNLIFDTKIAEDGKIINTNKILIDVTTAVSEETLASGVWNKRFLQQVDDSTLIKVHQASNKVGWQMGEARDVPGNPMVDTRVEEDGKVTTITKTLKDTTLITSGEVISGGNWIRTHKEEVSDLVANEIVESRPIPGNPLVTTRVEEDGMVTTVTKILKDTTTITSSEVISGGNWIRTFKEEVSDLVANEVKESRPIPGNPVPTSEVDKDGVAISVVRTLKRSTDIDTGEEISGVDPDEVWIKTESEKVSDLVSWERVTARAIPGNPLVTTRIEKDGSVTTITKVLGDTSHIFSSEVIDSGFWIKTFKEEVSDIVAYQVQEITPIPGNNVLSSEIDGDREVENITTRLVDQSTITPSSTEAGGFVTTVEKKDVSDLVANSVQTVTKWLDKASYTVSIINLIPREFMAFITTNVESHILAGTASLQTLGFGQLEVSERQLDKLLFERRVTTLGAPTLPITHTNQELTEEYGGGVLNVTYSLVLHGTVGIDQGYLVTRSSLLDLGNGMDVKETAQLDGTAWPTITGTAFDQDLQIEYPVEEQVVPTTYVVTTGAFILETLDPIDDWRSKRKKVTKTPINVDSSTAIVTIKYHPFRFPGLLTFVASGLTSGYYVRASDSQLCQHKIRTWWENSAGTPSVPSVDEIIMDDPIISRLNNVFEPAYAGPCLHDDITTFTVFFFPATTPSYTEYKSTWEGNEKVVAASVDKTDIPNLWKIQTISVIMR